MAPPKSNRRGSSRIETMWQPWLQGGQQVHRLRRRRARWLRLPRRNRLDPPGRGTERHDQARRRVDRHLGLQLDVFAPASPTRGPTRRRDMLFGATNGSSSRMPAPHNLPCGHHEPKGGQGRPESQRADRRARREFGRDKRKPRQVQQTIRSRMFEYGFTAGLLVNMYGSASRKLNAWLTIEVAEH